MRPGEVMAADLDRRVLESGKEAQSARALMREGIPYEVGNGAAEHAAGGEQALLDTLIIRGLRRTLPAHIGRVRQQLEDRAPDNPLKQPVRGEPHRQAEGQ